MKVYCILLSGGSGSRLGSDIPKQYIEVGGRSILSYSYETIANNEKIAGIWIVADPIYEEKILDSIKEYGDKLKGFALPGKNRQLSIYNGLLSVSKYAGSEDDLVIIHDAARPFVSNELINECIAAAMSHDGVMPALPMKDTVYISKAGRITSLLDRNTVVAGQAPEVFRLAKYIKANERLIADEKIDSINGSTEVAIAAGMDIAVIPGQESNYKITTKEDLDRFKRNLVNT